nr:hypothetical protein GCM10020241_30290 [Streptoalloteichus tenebrarius]
MLSRTAVKWLVWSETACAIDSDTALASRTNWAMGESALVNASAACPCQTGLTLRIVSVMSESTSLNLVPTRSRHAAAALDIPPGPAPPWSSS